MAVRKIIAVSGPISSGKTSLCEGLCERFSVEHVRTKGFLESRSKNLPNNRLAMQDFGEVLDKKTKGGWVAKDLVEYLRGRAGVELVIVDAVRIAPQIEKLRSVYERAVVHVHLMASTVELSKRFNKRRAKRNDECANYQQAQSNITEQRVGELESIADIVINTEQCTEQDVQARVASHLGLFEKDHGRVVDVLVGGQFGSEGKGHIAWYMSPEYDWLIRVGGPNAGHTVRVGNGSYTFHSLPSGSLTSRAKLIIGPGAAIDVQQVLGEIKDCQIESGRLFIDPQVMIITDKDRRAEQKLIGAIGSTGQGVGHAQANRILMRHKPPLMAGEVAELRPFVRKTAEVLDEAFASGKGILLEGTQGTGLSLYHGHYPHVTSRDTTVAGCLAECGIAPNRVRKVLMVCRTYPIRVKSPSEAGRTSGYMSMPISWAEVARRSGLNCTKLRKAEHTSTTHKLRRVSEFDWDLLRRAASLNAPTDIALTFADYIDKQNQDARRFEQLTDETIKFIEEVERVAAAPVALVSTRFDERSIIDRRRW